MGGSIASLGIGAVFGLALAAPPGPMNAIIADESVRRGWVAGVLAGLGAMTADACFLVLASLGLVGIVERRPMVRAAMMAVGGLLMLYFAYGAARDGSTFAGADAGTTNADLVDSSDAVYSRDPVEATHLPRTNGDARRGFWKALVLAITNPYQILFWLTVGVGLLYPGTVDVLSYVPLVGESLTGALVVRTGEPMLILGLFLGIGVWVVGFPGTLVIAGRRLDRLAPAVSLASAAVLGAFGVWFLLDAVGTIR